MPAVTSASRTTSSASPSRSRASSVEKDSSTIGATSRPASGNTWRCGSARQPASPSSNAPVSAAELPVSQPCPALILVDILDVHLLAGDPLREGRCHEPVEVSVQHVAWRGGSDAGAKVLHQLVWLEDVRADLVAPADVGLGRIGGVGLRLTLLKFGFVK